MNCPNCAKKNIISPMRIVRHNEVNFYKCPVCGHMTLIQPEGTKRQDWERDNV